MTQDEKKAEEVLINFQKATQSWFRGESLDMDKRRETMINLLANALTEARQQVAKQKDERIAELEKRVRECKDEWFSACERYRQSQDMNTELREENDRLKAESERLLKDTGERVQTISNLSVRLSEELGHLKIVLDYGWDGDRKRCEEACDFVNKTDNARLLKRERLRDAVIQDAKKVVPGFSKIESASIETLESLLKVEGSRNVIINQDGSITASPEMERLREDLLALEAHEKEGGV